MKKKNKLHRCSTPGCGNKNRPGNKFCYSCLTRKYRQAHPDRYAYMTLRDNAKRRKKPFSISFEYFKQFCYETGYLVGKGRTKNSFSVDRIIEHIGYVEGNLQVLPVGKNKKKHLEYDWQTRSARVVSGERPVPSGDDYF